MKAILLIRVSTKKQDYTEQERELREYAISKGYTELIPIKTKESGYKDLEEREGILEMYQKIDEDVNHEIKAVFAWELSRLSRSQEVLQRIKKRLVERGINIIIKNIDFCLLDENGKESFEKSMTYSMLGEFAQAEMRDKIDRFERAKKQYKRLGKYIGGRLAFGYKVDENKNIVIDNEKIEGLDISKYEIVKYVFKCYANPQNSISSLSKHCLELGYPYVSNTTNLLRLLKNKTYTGKGYLKCPIIIPEDEFENIQYIIRNKNTTADKTANKNTFLLKGLLKCPICKSLYTIHSANNEYKCIQKITRYGEKLGSCDSSNISITKIESIIWNVIISHALNSESYKPKSELERKEKIESIKIKIENLNKEIKKKEEKKRKISLAFFADGIEEKEYLKRNKEIVKEIEYLNKQINKYNSEIDSLKVKVNLSNQIAGKIHELMTIKDRKTMKELIHYFIKEIYIYNGEKKNWKYCEIYYNDQENTDLVFFNTHRNNEYSININSIIEYNIITKKFKITTDYTNVCHMTNKLLKPEKIISNDNLIINELDFDEIYYYTFNNIYKYTETHYNETVKEKRKLKHKRDLERRNIQRRALSEEERKELSKKMNERRKEILSKMPDYIVEEIKGKEYKRKKKRLEKMTPEQRKEKNTEYRKRYEAKKKSLLEQSNN